MLGLGLGLGVGLGLANPTPNQAGAAAGGGVNSGPWLLFMSDREQASTGEETTDALRGRRGYWDAQARHFEGLRLLHSRAASSALPRWTLLVDDDSYVVVRHLLRYAKGADTNLRG